MIQYVCGFLFDDKETNKVLLIKKNRPDWQKGLYNGVGGKVENNEMINIAMRREFFEETGLFISHWNRLTVIYGLDYECWFYYAYGPVNMCKSMTDEQVEVFDIKHLPNVVYNINWLIPLAQDKEVKLPIILYA